MTDKLLILDLDETLIHSVETPFEHQADFCFGKFYTYKRPYLREFLEFCFEHFEVAVWTSSTTAYAEEIVKNILTAEQKLTFLWTRSRCTISFDEELGESYYSKKLDKVRKRGFDLNSIIAIDDSPRKWRYSYGNLIRVTIFEGDRKDEELDLLMKYLLQLKDVVNVRETEKRGWRNVIKS